MNLVVLLAGVEIDAQCRLELDGIGFTGLYQLCDADLRLRYARPITIEKLPSCLDDTRHAFPPLDQESFVRHLPPQVRKRMPEIELRSLLRGKRSVQRWHIG